ncbi:MAG: alpha/beta fold hydrolase [Pseudomonadota bacterium]
MGVLAFRILVGIAVAYLATLALLFVFQSRFIYPAPQERHDPAPGFEAVELLTPDGLDLTVHWRPPETGKPVVVWFHGNASSLAGSTAETSVLAENGYGVLLASYRGYGGNAGEPSEQGFYEDGRVAMKFLAEQGIAPAQTIVGGTSIGSGTATQMAMEFRPGALILISPFTSLTDVASNALPIFPVRLLLRDKYDNSAKLSELEAPVLIQHGTADNVVPFEQGKALSEKANDAVFESFEGAGHDLSFVREAQKAQALWLESRGFGLDPMIAPITSSEPDPLLEN